MKLSVDITKIIVNKSTIVFKTMIYLGYSYLDHHYL